MKKIYLTIIFVITSLNVANAQDGDPFEAVQKLFSSISAYDYEAMYGSATDDFQLLEQGEIWDMAKLEEAVNINEGFLERRNFFSVIKTVDNGDSVWISYWNRADIKTTDGDTASVAWLESVVVIEQKGQWKLQMMHSTGIKGTENLPEGLVMEEYIGKDAFMITE